MANFDKALNIADKKLFGNQFSSYGVESFKKGLHNINKGKYSDPTFLGFTLLFDWESPLLSMDTRYDTAYGYLDRNGEYEKSEMLKKFQTILYSLNKEMPWYWQTIEGLGRAYELMTDFTDPFRGGNDAVISIGTLESIDLRMAMIINLYRKACYDFKYRRDIVPSNLRKFNLTITIKEIRNFNTVLNAIDKLSALGVPTNVSVAESSGFFNGYNKTMDFMTQKSKDTARIVNDNTSTIIYNFYGCEINAAQSSEVLTNVNNSSAEETKNKFSFTYSDVEEISNFSLLDFILTDLYTSKSDEDLTFDEKLKKRMEHIGKETALNNSERLVNSAEQFAKAKINKLILGNVYGKNVGTSALNALTRSTIDGTIRDISVEQSLLDKIKKDE